MVELLIFSFVICELSYLFHSLMDIGNPLSFIRYRLALLLTDDKEGLSLIYVSENNQRMLSQFYNDLASQSMMFKGLVCFYCFATRNAFIINVGLVVAGVYPIYTGVISVCIVSFLASKK
jgi:hypothetical protein